jgi:hypothetical protein
MWLRATGVGAALAVVAGTASAAPQTRLLISGAFQTTSARAVLAHDEACGFKTKARVLGYMSDAMRIGRGLGVARVEFTIPHYRGRARYDARIPAPYSRTAVQVVTGRNAATGAASGFYIATSGSVTVGQSKNVGRAGHGGSVSGTVHANLRLQRDSKRLRLDGNWHCRIDPGSSGG